MEIQELKEQYENVINNICMLLDNDQNWKEKYGKYIDFLNEVKELKGRFKKPTALDIYCSLSEQRNNNEIQLRYLGVKVATIILCDDKKIQIKFEKEGCEKFHLFLSVDFTKKFDWKDPVATTFRKHFTDISNEDYKDSIKKEAKFENRILYTMQNKSKNSIYLNGLSITPIISAEKAFFQMPTAISASKKDNIHISTKGHGGGGIDILARKGKGRYSSLTLFELKDENTESESPEMVMKQALSYATFLVKLIECKGDSVWTAFGYGQKSKFETINHNNTIIVCCLMPNINKKGELARIPSFVGIQPFVVGDYKLELHYLYFEELEDGLIRVARSSLIK